MGGGGFNPLDFFGIGGGGGGGGGASGDVDAWNQKALNGASWGALDLQIKSREVTWRSVLAGLVGAYSVVRQYQLNKRMVDLQERSVKVAEEYLKLAQRAYDEISLPTFNRLRDHFDYARDKWRPRLDEFMAEAFRLKEYRPQYAIAQGRAMSTVQSEFDKARKMRQRSRGRYEIGRACHEDILFAIAGAQARVAAADAAFRYEDTKKLKLDEWYWQRQSAGADAAANGLANAISGLNGAVAGVASGLSAISTGVARVAQAANQAEGAYGNMRDYWGTIGNGAFGMGGWNRWFQGGQSPIGFGSTVTPDQVSRIGQSSITGLTGAGTLSTSPRPVPRPATLNSGDANEVDGV